MGNGRRESLGQWLRIGALFIPLVALECYWAFYSAVIVNGSSFDSIWPPIHITFTLALLSGLLAPIHRAVRAGRRWAKGAAGGVLWITLVGCMAGLTSLRPDWLGGDAFVGSAATILTAVAWFPFLAFLRRTRPLDERELLALYGLLAVGSLVTGFGTTNFLLPTIVAHRYYASASNHWEKQIFPLLSRALYISSDKTAKDFFVGHRAGVPWRLWLEPLGLWTIYVMLICTVMLGLNGIVRRLWINQERLTFPQAYLPVEMARQEPGALLNRFFRSPFMWAGFFVAVGLEAAAGIHTYFPSTPSLEIRHINLMAGVGPGIWRSMGGLEITVYPCIVGITYLLTTEVSWSSWFFYVLRKLLPVMGAQFGWQDNITQDGSVFPFQDQQSTGAFLAIGILALWGVVRMLRTARKQGQTIPIERREALALILGVPGLVLWMRLVHASIPVTVGLLSGFLLFSLAYTRVRAEAGLGGLTGPLPPQDAIVEAFGSHSFSSQDLAGMESIRWSCWDLRFLPSEMPAELENYKIGDMVGISSRAFFWGMLAAIFVGLVISYAIELPLIYYYGGNQLNNMRFSGIPQDTLRVLSHYISAPRPTDTTALSAGTFGFLFTLLLALLRARMFAFPFHPVGFAIGFSRRTIEWMWFSVFLGWLFKVLTLRGGGLKAYRVMLPFFLGIILGDFFAGGVFGLVGCIFPGTAGYSVYP